MNRHYQQIAQAIHFFIDNQSRQPGLSEVAGFVGLSEYHLQRKFSAWVGVSPKQFLQFLTKEEAKRQLSQSSVLDAALASGLSGSSRLHDLFVQIEGMTPGEYKTQGKGLVIHYGMQDSPFGLCFLAQTPRGICKLAFFDSEEQFDVYEQELTRDWNNATLLRDDAALAATMHAIFPSEAQNINSTAKPLRLLIKGSAFQLQVWQALLRIPAGDMSTYQSVAQTIDAPKAVRAVASAIAKNDIGYLIPCHRVIRKTGEFNEYRWGRDRKAAMLGWERVTQSTPACHQTKA